MAPFASVSFPTIPAATGKASEVFDPFLDRAADAEVVDEPREVARLLSRADGQEAVFTFPALPEVYGSRLILDAARLVDRPDVVLDLPRKAPSVVRFRAGVWVNVGFFAGTVFIGFRTGLKSATLGEMRLSAPARCLRYSAAASLCLVPGDAPIFARMRLPGEKECTARLERLGPSAAVALLPAGFNHPVGTAIRPIILIFGGGNGSMAQRYSGALKELTPLRSRLRRAVFGLTPDAEIARHVLEKVAAALRDGAPMPRFDAGDEPPRRKVLP